MCIINIVKLLLTITSVAVVIMSTVGASQSIEQVGLDIIKALEERYNFSSDGSIQYDPDTLNLN